MRFERVRPTWFVILLPVHSPLLSLEVTGISANATKKGKQTNDQSKEVDQTNKNNEEEEEEEYNLPDNPSFLGCEYMHITFAEEEDLENLLKLKRSDLSENFDLTLDYSCEVDEEEDAMEDETVSELPSAASRWIQAYQETLADPKELEKESNAFMRQFDSKIRQVRFVFPSLNNRTRNSLYFLRV